MVTLIRTFKRINKSASTQSRCSLSSKTKIVTKEAHTSQHVTASHVHQDGQLKKTANSAIDVIKLNEKGRARTPPNPNNTSNNSPQTKTQKASSIAITGTSDVRYAVVAANSEEKNF